MPFGRALMWQAAKKGNGPVVKLLITTDSANPDSEGSNGRIPQSFSAERDYKAVIKFLIKYVDIMADSKESD